jgi:hypothetical protein
MRRFVMGSVVAAVALSLAEVALASSVSLTPQYFLSGANTSWDISSTPDQSGAGDPNPCLTSHTTFAGAVDASTVTPSSGDAFDGGLMPIIGGHGLTVAGDAGTYNGTDTVSAGPTKMSGLDVGVKETNIDTGQVLRMLMSFKNRSSKAISTTFVLDTALGDNAAGERIDGTSSGDKVLTVADRWIVTRNSSGTDATPTLVFYGKGNVTTKVAAVTKQPEVTGCTTVKLKVSIPANSTRYLMFFTSVHAHGDETQAESDAAAFNSVGTGSPLLAGLSAKVRQKILNWKF